ncbi:MAG: 6-phosphogluconolactonase [Candidatus Electronema aureum]|uniref:6-phosphogluconolactonase n=1 Tax=Candidatus Electronema aureum TaxID=2005002 RepID=A0A521G1J6_9BACT|nr:MAG: 6-phosphogluconolactonase [Candidatus Electronema aureum]
MELRTFLDRQTLVNELAEHIAAALSASIAAHGRASLVVSGGSTPVPLFERLSNIELSWQKVVITLADERWVEPTSSDSNEALVRRHLLQNRAADAIFVGLKNAAATAEEGEAECEDRLNDIPQPFTVVILGMGNDGHTASLFPCAAQLAHATDMHCGKLCTAVRPQTAPHQRMSLTLPAILSAKEILLHITGADKKAVLEKALADGPSETMPIRFILRQQTVPMLVYWAE